MKPNTPNTFTDFLIEGKVSNILLKEFPRTETIFNIDEKSDKIILNVVVVPYKVRKQGKGTKFMKRLIEIAREKNKDLYLNVSDMYADENDPKKDDLYKWYKKLGFKETNNFKLNGEMMYKV